ncbi:type II toxin-antitoxin system RelB/DinJ family antitoxin [Leptotrichia massiliensis]|uniref:type II toxin-antitoxin system RelB/DinJ family antitoxin n=1 Tax=Leptotrichia massiliensis TaxID=1852388 RepID=UPI0028E6F874|nr:type II toxin-antitoxin system antitoxin, RelB/DinJ family [Leptotrichia massiliensis]
MNLRIDDTMKKNAEQAYSDTGFSLSATIKKLGSERRIPFEITADPFYSKQNMEHLNQSIQNVKKGKTTLKEHELIEME